MRAFRELRRDVALAYHTAVFSRAKKLKDLAAYLRKIKSPVPVADKPAQSVQDMEAAARLWTRALGGTFRKGTKQ